MASEASWWNPSWMKRADNKKKSVEEDCVLHRKRLAAILRYIASMHESVSSSGESSRQHFVREVDDDDNIPDDFFQRETFADTDVENGVLFSTNDFRKLISVDAIGDNQGSQPFAFYAPAQNAFNDCGQVVEGRNSKRMGVYGLSSVFTHSKNPRGGRNCDGRGIWLRLTRIGPSSLLQQPNYDHPSLQHYLNVWLKESSTACSIDELLTLHNLDRAPSISSTTSMRNHKRIEHFLRTYKSYLRMKLYQQTLEPIYNSLFEWNQQQNENNEEIVWGLGHAKMLTYDGRLINGPLLEVLVEVELAFDGALLIRPREHTGVTLNREVIAALVATGADPSSLNAVLSQLHKAVANIEISSISPAQPQTYVPFLKRIAVELSAGGAFRASSGTVTPGTNTKSKRKEDDKMTELGKLEVSEAWCLYARSKPSSIWARDANLLADRVGNHRELLPLATWSLTHGSTKLEQVLQEDLIRENDDLDSSMKKKAIATWLQSNLLFAAKDLTEASRKKKEHFSNKPIFPLATSDSQIRIADLLLRQNYPAVIAEGPPGTGKTHTIANIVSAYLCKGKRVLVTSKNANALSVLRGRLPQSVRELVVDVSMSELHGMRQLQQTVERLAVRVSVASADIETEKCSMLQHTIDDLEIKLEEIDKEVMAESERVRNLLQQPDGMTLIEKASYLITSAPWLMRSLAEMNLNSIKSLAGEMTKLRLDLDDPVLSVTGFDSPPSKSLISLASARSGSSLSSLSQVTKATLSSLPIIGPAMDSHIKQVYKELDKLNLNGTKPESKDDWKTIAKALKHSLAVCTFEDTIWRSLVKEKKWPQACFQDQKRLKEIHDLLDIAVEVKELHILLNVKTAIKAIAKCRKLDAMRTRISRQIRYHSEDLTDSAVVAELSRSFSPDAQSALIKFAQIAGASKFSRSSKPSKMSQRQRRRRQEYLTAFDRCCRFIPCWILTTSQISDYLPAECLFDLVVIDESSQSDVTVLPGMMRGKQWLIVGDGKQVSPTEAFVSEENIENIRATLPESPLEDALLPGRSFFDMCAQAFPRGRVVLNEHFRCAPEIIGFSNVQFYDGRLIPLRLPTALERMKPSILDVRVVGGSKVGKVNEKEADKIVEMIKHIVMESSEKKSKPKSIGVISLVGDEQSRLIRGRLLDSCGPEHIARHDVLIGDPPLFQGAERDIVFLSMVCSRGNMVTQSQQFHYQRANVALSRARDRVVLVRSIDLRDVPSLDDVKIPIIEFFINANVSTRSSTASDEHQDNANSNRPKQFFGREIVRSFLVGKGYRTVDMSMIWKNAFCVEDQKSDIRVAIMIDCEERQKSDWVLSYSQQKAIERVGWKCLRIDTLSVVLDFTRVVNVVTQFLTANGLGDPREHYGHDEEEGGEDDIEHLKESQKVIDVEDMDEAIGTSSFSEENDIISEHVHVNDTRPDQTKSSVDFITGETIEPWQFGEVVNLDFLRSKTDPADGFGYDDGDGDDDDDGNGNNDKNHIVTSIKRRTILDQSGKATEKQLKHYPSDSNCYQQGEDMKLHQCNDSVVDNSKVNVKSVTSTVNGRSRKRRKIAKYSQNEHLSQGRQMSDKVDNKFSDRNDDDNDIPSNDDDDDDDDDGDESWDRGADEPGSEEELL
ncbi:unnamed protein product [Pseudo-nitzschia multistriata]|uniref:AAA+ ATPase domain-containing protein n=1 Tax=Pseudo-nitzschia multistriata TaxID=183589 RepID=A0A448Z5Q3_9STRA|nr:unnamed protein product [Pseudo-nitzschia multistriata]